MESLDFSSEDAALLAFDPSYDPASTARLNYLTPANTWPLPNALAKFDGQHQHLQHNPLQHQTMSHDADAASHHRSVSADDVSTLPVTTAPSLQTSGLGFAHHTMDPSAALLTDWTNFPHLNHNAQSYLQDGTIDGTIDPSAFTSAYGAPLHSSPIDFAIPQNTLNTTLSMDANINWATTTSMDNMNSLAYSMGGFQQELINFPVGSESALPTTTATATSDFVPSSVGGSSPSGGDWLEIRSLSSSDNGWSAVDFPHHHPNRRSFDMMSDGSNVIIFNPNQTLHIRTDSDSSQHSDVPRSAHSFASYDEGVFPMNSPQSEDNLDLNGHQHMGHCHHGLSGVYMGHEHDNHSVPSSNHSPIQYTVSPAAISDTMAIMKPAPPTVPAPASTSSFSTSPSSAGASSPPTTSRSKKSPTSTKSNLDKVAKTIQKKSAHTTKKDIVTEKKVGRRRGPLRPDQRQQAHEIRKLRACLRCKFLKKTCDKGDPCAGCQPSHARLWQVPCTRIDIKDIAYFMKDWKADYERHVSLGFSVGNIKGFSQIERRIYITHGYGFYLPINAREVYVRDDKCFGVDWVESIHETPKNFETNTAKLSAGMEGISPTMLSEYLDRHIDGGFERFVDEYFEGTFFVTEILKTAYRFYLREKLPVIRKALKLVLAYNLTLHVTMVEGLEEAEAGIGRVDDSESKFWGKTVAPVMINFQVKCALADMWRELQKDVLEELSALYSSVYSGDKLKNWPTIFMLAAILLAVWELMQFDCHYRVPDEKAVKKFCDDMESTPVGVIVGLFSAISQKLPSFSEWDTRKHHHLLASNPAVCDAMTEVRAHVHQYETYLKSRTEAKFDRQDFDSLSNKFLAKLVIRAN